MSTVEIIQRASSIDPGAERPAGPRGRVVVVYEAGTEGRAALRYAHALAARTGAPLTVVTVASHERTDIGCGCGRQAAAFRNELASECAAVELAAARELIGVARTDIVGARAQIAVEYVLARGSFTSAVLDSADDQGADVIVLPARRGGPLRRIASLSPDRAKRLQRRTAREVIVAPRAAPEQRRPGRR